MIRVELISEADAADVRAFNARLRAAGVEFQSPARLTELTTPVSSGPALWAQVWVARDDETVRGGFILKHERLFLADGVLDVGNFQLPLSEGIVDRRYAMVAFELVRTALRENARLYSLGMGGMHRPLPRVLARLGWTVESVPFFFRVIRGGTFARNIRALRTSKLRRFLLDAAAFTGLASVSAACWRVAARVTGSAPRRSVNLTPVPDFDARVDAVFEACKPLFGAMLERGSEALNLKFPRSDARLLRFLVEKDGRCIGWLIVTVTQLHGHRQFGSMHLGAIVDGLMPPEFTGAAIASVTEVMTRMGVDTIVSNQSHSAWRSALRDNLFLPGSSNFVLARSPGFATGISLSDLHVNRGDGDGPINL